MLCLCGCKQEAKEGRKYINGHNMRGKKNPGISEFMKNGGSEYVRGFVTERGRRSQAEKISKWIKMKWDDPNSTYNSEGRNEKIRKYMKNGGGVFAHSFNTEESNRNRSEYMKSVGSAHASSFIINPSKLQVETWKNACKVCPYVYLNFPVYRGKGKKNYSIDIAIPKLGVAIETDGSYWHQDIEADLKRQQELEEDGWRFIRYVDKPPTIEQLEEDILDLV